VIRSLWGGWLCQLCRLCEESVESVESVEREKERESVCVCMSECSVWEGMDGI